MPSWTSGMASCRYWERGSPFRARSGPSSLGFPPARSTSFPRTRIDLANRRRRSPSGKPWPRSAQRNRPLWRLAVEREGCCRRTKSAASDAPRRRGVLIRALRRAGKQTICCICKHLRNMLRRRLERVEGGEPLPDGRARPISDVSWFGRKGAFLRPGVTTPGVARSRGQGWPKATALARRVASLTAASTAPGWIRTGPTERTNRRP